MGRVNYYFTSESVSEGHPDKMSDQISDSVLDAMLAQDPNSRVACETLVTTGLIFIAGEITTKAIVDIQKLARETVREIGYDRAEYGFDCNTCSVISAVGQQSPDIAMGVNRETEEEQGAGDQGLMFGYASNETKEFMPMPILLAHKITRKLAEVRKKGILDYLRPDSKSQVTIEYQDCKPVRIDTVVVSTQHSDKVSQAQIREDVIREVITPILPPELVDSKTMKYHVNPTGRFVIGGPMGDCGLTGRKIIVDTYGGVGSHGGGAFSGKDPSKVDRSASYMGRYVAKNIVAAGLADRCEIQLAYAIGVADPVSIMIDTFRTNKVDPEKIKELVRDHFNLRPSGIIKTLNLKRPIFKPTAAYGHFGRNEPGFTWEVTDKAEILRKAAGL